MHLSAISEKKIPPSFVMIEEIPRPFMEGEIVQVKTGQVASFEEMIEDFRKVHIVYVGETHINRAHHDIQLKILQELFAKNRSVRVGMEMFERSYQPILDQWSSGSLTEETFLKKVNWEENWSFDFSLYRDILYFIRENHINFTALNIPPEIVKKVATHGLASLSEEERAQIAQDIDLSDAEHRTFARERFAEHDIEGLHGFDNFYKAQCVWDDSMAESVAKMVESDKKDIPIVIFAGNGHIERFGIPKRVQRRVNVSDMTVMPVAVGATVKQTAADYIWVTKTEKRHKHPLIGIKIKPITEGEGLLVEGVMPGSPAETAGIKENDILIAIDDLPVSSVLDIHRAIVGPQSNRSYLFQIKRGGETLEYTVTPIRDNDHKK
jgi:uncharacterized iron-regulated protein